MKNWVWMFIALLAFQSAGCASVQKKFTRKKKAPSHVAATIYTDQGPYEKQFSNDYYYRTHYSLWKTWHDELLSQFDGNRKKTKRNAQESLSHLSEMAEYLVPEAQANLRLEVDRMKRLTDRIESGISDSEAGGVRVDLEGIGRRVANNFYYDKIKTSIQPDRVELEGEGAAPSA